MLLDPVGQSDIAERAGVQPDTVKKWITRHEGFPTPHQEKVAGRRVWEWAEVEQWLIDTGRAPGALRYLNLGALIAAQTLVDGDIWRTAAAFVGSDDTGWVAYPQPWLLEASNDPRGSANDLLQGWIKARQRWAQQHPDEPMPAHLRGTRRALGPDYFAENAPDPEPAQPDPVMLTAVRDHLLARAAELDRRLGDL